MQLIKIAAVFGVCIITASIMPIFVGALIALVFVSALSVSFISMGNSILQLTSQPTMRGRVMSLWMVAFAVGGVSALVAAGVGLLASRSVILNNPVTAIK